MRGHVVKFHIFRLGSADSTAPTFTSSHGVFYLLWNVSALFSNVAHGGVALKTMKVRMA